MKSEVLVFCLNWISANSVVLVEVLTASIPVLALLVAGLALYLVGRKVPGARAK